MMAGVCWPASLAHSASVLFYCAVSTMANVYVLGILQKNRGEKWQTMQRIHLPLVYAVVGVVLLQRYIHVDNEWLESLLRSVAFLVFCLPLMYFVDRKVKLVALLRAALFKPA